ncbi:flagellar export chaperone FliS [Aureliella helgolandensis]|uniref:Flagellar protein FliS n=1 Tax=Aureliella helgolandensis TaxID=2527968 RepID=A0A518GD84_9BACT|nr:flagellar export chaperone FliS [Aureliella helgolandensis]QDV26556.1 flagellar protein FliS [Aureliella helgolandensis]
MHSGQLDQNPYLQQEVLTASPLRLRWMLINRAEELCRLVAQLWQQDNLSEAAGWLLRIREILGELLDGVTDKSNPASASISDFYVFLLRCIGEVELSQDRLQLKTLEELLHIEAETWQMVIQNNSENAPEADLGDRVLGEIQELQQQANEVASQPRAQLSGGSSEFPPQPAVPNTPPSYGSNLDDLGSSFSLEI